jgi:hypothetical protein
MIWTQSARAAASKSASAPAAASLGGCVPASACADVPASADEEPPFRDAEVVEDPDEVEGELEDVSVDDVPLGDALLEVADWLPAPAPVPLNASPHPASPPNMSATMPLAPYTIGKTDRMSEGYRRRRARRQRAAVR